MKWNGMKSNELKWYCNEVGCDGLEWNEMKWNGMRENDNEIKRNQTNWGNRN